MQSRKLQIIDLNAYAYFYNNTLENIYGENIFIKYKHNVTMSKNKTNVFVTFV